MLKVRWQVNNKKVHGMAEDTRSCDNVHSTISSHRKVNSHVTAKISADKNMKYNHTTTGDESSLQHHTPTATGDDTKSNCHHPPSSDGDEHLKHLMAGSDEMSAPHRTARGEITQYLNVYNAKLLAVVCVAASIIYHGFIHLYFGTNSCTWLLSDGRFQGYNAWQPYGCMIHKYTKLESRNCMHYISYWGGHNNIVFLGDSRIRQIYFEFISLLQPEAVKPFKSHSDLSYTDDKINLKVEFLWYPIVDSTMETAYMQLVERRLRDRPTLLITGSATWTIKTFNATFEALDDFKANLTNIVQYFDKLSNTTEVLWMLQDPVIEQKLNANRSMITNSQIDEYNRAAIETVSRSKAKFWRSSRLVAQGYSADSEDGLHAGKVALTWDVQILMNKYCNDHMNFNDGTCCSSSEPVTTLQIITAVIFGISLLVYIIMSVWLKRSPWKKTLSRAECLTFHQPTPDGTVEEGPSCCNDHIYEFFASMARLGIIMSFFLLCDRTNFFMKENKYYTHMNFFLPFSYLMILGFFFTEKSDQSTFLHRDQTDEWKGWMQLVILIYHLTGASQVLHIYMQIRVLVSSYLFLSGYGNFYYFFMKGDFSFYRFCKVMFRFNFLVVLLCFVMNRPYQFYYFIPLVSFWFLVLYLTLAVWPQVTSASIDSHSVHYLYLTLKLVALAVAITLLYASEVFFEKVFLTNPIKALFVTSDDSVQEWRFRWSLDRYSTLYGVVFALATLTARKLKLFEDSHNELLLPRVISWLVAFFSFCGILGYAIFIGLCRTKEECNEVHPYLAFVPIVSYIFLRNIFGWVRTKYSTFFAWFGRISLELFIAQYHIWLAADTHGVLVLVPSYQVMNVVVTSFVFVCTAHEIHSLTLKLTEYAVPNDWRILLRNMMCFAAVLVPVAITHGAFGV